jgi:hypothetical protein
LSASCRSFVGRRSYDSRSGLRGARAAPGRLRRDVSGEQDRQTAGEDRAGVQAGDGERHEVDDDDDDGAELRAGPWQGGGDADERKI